MAEEKKPVPNGINWENVSSQVKRTEYFPDKKELIIEFKNNSKYKYFNVLQETQNALAISMSIGKFINSDIKGKFEYVKL